MAAAAPRKLPVVDGAVKKSPPGKTTASGWAAFTDAGTAPRWVIAARVAMVVAFAATIPTVLGVEHGNRIVWTVAIASLPLFWMTFGYHLWRRICPLAVMGQLGRILGRPGARKMGDWMQKNYLLVQLGIMVACLTLRLLATNGSDVWLAGFLGAVVLAAVVTSFLYAGKTWCNFICPVGFVEKVHTEPAPSAIPASDLTSQCAPCVACKKHCPDIDLEQGYWKEAGERPRRIAYFAWPGIVVGFYTYYFLARGQWSDYFDGRWTYDRDLPARALEPGFYFAPAIPRVVAAPLTLVVFGLASYALFAAIEALVLRGRRATLPDPATDEQRGQLAARVHHGMLALAGLVAFNAFYCFAGQPTLQRLPAWVVTGFGLVVVFASTAMFMRRVSRREDQYVHEKFAQKILKKWEWGDAPPSDDLKDIYLLHTERTKQREARLRAYKETVREMVGDGVVTKGELVILDSLRAQLGVSDKDHAKIIGELSGEERQLFDPAYQGSVEVRLARQQYRRDLQRVVVEAARLGASPADSTLAQLRDERGVREDEEQAELAQILAPGGPIAALYAEELAAITRLADAADAANALGESGKPASKHDANDSASQALLRHLARRRAHEHVIHALGVLAVMTQRSEVGQVRAAAEARTGLRPAVLELLAGVPAAAREPLRTLLDRLASGAHGTLAAAPILAIADDTSRYVRAAAGMLLSRFDDEAARARLVAMMDDPEVIVREAAVRAMGARSRLTRELMAKALGDPEAAVRHAAVRAVGGSNTSGELPAFDPAMAASAATLHSGPAMIAQTSLSKSPGKAGSQPMYATLDANAAMASLTAIEKMMLIRQVPIFADLDAEDLEELALIVEERRVDIGKDLFREGDAGDAVYLIVKGLVRVFTGGDGERAERTLSELGPGQCIGEMAVLDASPRSATVRALQRTRTLRVPGEGFKRVMSERPEMSAAIVAELVRRMRGMMAQGALPSRAGSLPSIPIPPR